MGLPSRVLRPSRAVPTGLVALALLATVPCLSAQDKWAVVVGVNDYLNYEGIEDGDLRGAERDALIMRGVLVQRWGVPAENVRTLLSREATKDAIRRAVTEWAADRVEEGDLFVFYFAGHGSQAIDLDGDEPDGLDETIAPADVDRYSSELDIRDDELSEWLASVAGDAVVIFDSCHSGSATRATGNMLPRVLNREVPEEAVVRTRDLASGGGQEAQNMSDGSRTLVELAAAAPSQSAMEGFFQGPDGAEPAPGGAFTYHLVQQLWRAPPQASYEDLMRHVVSAMKAAHFTQDPQLEGPAGSSLFATRAAPTAAPAPPALVRVVRVAGSEVVLDAGRDRGLTEGSVLETEQGALLRVTSVAARSAEAAVVGGAPVEGAPATLIRVALPAPGLEVGVAYLPASLLPALEAALESLDGVTLTSDPEGFPELFVRPSEDDLAVEVLGRDGGVRSRVTRAAGAAATFRNVAALLRKELAVKRLASLDNPAAPFRVDVSLRGDSRVFQEGDTISFSVRSERPGYLTLIDLGMDGTVTVLHPNAFEDLGRLEAGRTVTIPGDWALFTVTEETGLGLVRAIVTPQPLGLAVPSGGVIQDAGGLRVAEEIRRLLEGGVDGLPASEWATALVVYEVIEGR